MRISDWSSDVCSSDLAVRLCGGNLLATFPGHVAGALASCVSQLDRDLDRRVGARSLQRACQSGFIVVGIQAQVQRGGEAFRRDRGGFQYQQTCARKGAMDQVNELTVGGVAVLGRGMRQARKRAVKGKGG